ncbi:family 20 glycosylhydrolase [Cellvibrio japonicus]|uniref:beta-N-acetylhexosaminidase n=1 Tax=Cellvibrio japonicus (strain Ueda107) TaxID=498211 RepID=B3PH90_CELJU|nr:family 20 glycosylhydrolase [Cellvibrio japonicus]ACE86226.1 beta-hexaminidase, putative, hex20B [Cellvibrio japonicus Ueda107]
MKVAGRISRSGWMALILGAVMGQGLAVGANAGNLTQAQLSQFARDAQLAFAPVSNFALGHGQFQAQLTLNNQSAIALPAGKGDWRIYIHSIRKLHENKVAGLQIKHVQGDLHALEPSADFTGLAAGASLEVPYSGGNWIVSYSDFMPRAFIAQPGLEAAVFANTDTEDLTRFVSPFVRPEQQLRFNAPTADAFPIVTSAGRYESNRAVNAIKPVEQLGIIPTPKSVKYRRGSIQLDGSWQIRYAGSLTSEARYLVAQLKAAGLELNSAADHIPAQGPVIRLALEPGGVSEAYHLSIGKEVIQIRGSDNAGAFYAVQSLLSLLPAQTAAQYTLPVVEVKDQPRFSWRGMHYDMGRNFHGKAVTLRLIEQMARYKLNKLHLHLTEDEGWRIEIPGLPELTEVGAFRCFDLTEQSCLLTQLGTGPHKSGSGNGYYSAEDFVEILKFAAARHIEVIPEIDMPGHARAAVKAMDARYHKLLKAGKKAEAEQFLLSDPADKSQYLTVQNYTDNSINVCLPSTYAFADKVVYELQQMYRKAGLKLNTFHMGGDEVGAGSWVESPACKTLFATQEGVAGPADLKPYFVSKLAAITHERGLALVGWEDGLMYDPNNTFNRKAFANERVLANAWDNIWEWGVADRAYRLANAGYQVILSAGTHLYFDHPHEAHPEERGYYWAARYTSPGKVFGFMPDNFYANADTTREGTPIDNLEALVGRSLPKLEKPENLLGMQGQVWSETIRTAQQLEQMIYPRLMSLGERAWHKAAWESNAPDTTARTADWAQFAHTLAKRDLPRLVQAGADLYLPPPGAVIESGQLLANTALPGLAIEFSLDKGASWQPWTAPVALTAEQSASVWLRSRLGDKTSRVSTL